MFTRRQFGLGALTAAALAVVAGCDDASTGPGGRTPEDEKKSEEARNASIEAMRKKAASKHK